MQKALRNKRTHIPRLHGPKGMIYSDEGKAELFADTMEVTCRTNDNMDEDIGHEENVDRTV